jgi:hypothetical protein
MQTSFFLLLNIPSSIMNGLIGQSIMIAGMILCPDNSKGTGNLCPSLFISHYQPSICVIQHGSCLKVPQHPLLSRCLILVIVHFKDCLSSSNNSSNYQWYHWDITMAAGVWFILISLLIHGREFLPCLWLAIIVTISAHIRIFTLVANKILYSSFHQEIFDDATGLVHLSDHQYYLQQLQFI